MTTPLSALTGAVDPLTRQFLDGIGDIVGTAGTGPAPVAQPDAQAQFSQEFGAFQAEIAARQAAEDPTSDTADTDADAATDAPTVIGQIVDLLDLSGQPPGGGPGLGDTLSPDQVSGLQSQGTAVRAISAEEFVAARDATAQAIFDNRDGIAALFALSGFSLGAGLGAALELANSAASANGLTDFNQELGGLLGAGTGLVSSEGRLPGSQSPFQQVFRGLTNPALAPGGSVDLST